MGDLTNTETILEAAARVRGLFEDADKLDTRAGESRLKAGQWLRILRGRVELEGRSGWNEWCDQNISRSRGEIAKVMRLARSDDPKAAAQTERENARRQKAEQRQRDKSKSLQDDVSDVRDTETQQLLAVTQEEKLAAAAAEQRRQQTMAAAFQADKEARRVQEELEAGTAVVSEAVNAAAIETNLDYKGDLLWKRVPFVVEKIGSVLSIPEMHALRTLQAVSSARMRRAFADAISNWISSSAACADGPTPEPEPDADETGVDYEDLTGPGIETRNAARIAALGDGA